MAAVDVVLPTEQRRGLVQQRRLDGADVLGQAVDLLMHVRLDQVKNRPALEFLLGARALHPPVPPVLEAAPHVFRQGVLERHGPAADAVPALQVAVAEDQVVQGEPGELAAPQELVRPEGADQDVALHVDAAGVVRAAAECLCEAIERDRRLVPLAVVQALDVVEQLAPIEHGRRIPERERLHLLRGRGHGCQFGVHHKISRMLARSSLRPSMGSWARACSSAQARSAWPTSSPRPDV